MNFSLLIRSYSSGENSDDLSSDFYVSISDISISLFPSPRQERKNDAITIEHQKQYDYLISRQSHLPISGFVLNKNIIFIYLFIGKPKVAFSVLHFVLLFPPGCPDIPEIDQGGAGNSLGGK